MPHDEPIEDFLLHGNPNPNRIGCPGSDVLRRAARKELSIGDPAFDHLGNCSPCFQEFRKYQAQIKEKPGFRAVRLIRSRILVGALASAAAVLVFWNIQARFWQSSRVETSYVSYDARALSGERGGDAIGSMKPIELVRAHALRLSITLPLGLGPGTYDIRLSRVTDPGPVLLSTGAAKVNETTHYDVLSTRLRTDELLPGKYNLYFRRNGDVQWWPLQVVVR